MTSTDDDVSLAGKVVIVTGASRGIGRGIGLHLARRGVSLTINGRKEDRLRDVAAEIEAIGARLEAALADGSPLWDTRWVDWEPDPSWGDEVLPTGWDRVPT